MTSTEPDPSIRWRALSAALAIARQTGASLSASDWTDAVQDESEAYAVQDDVASRLNWARPGAAVMHWKSGGASRSGPFSHAPLDPAGIGRIDPRWTLLGIEAEIALRLAHDVTPEAAERLTPDQAVECIDAMAVSVELVASRWPEGLDAPALLRMADHQSHGALVLGPWQDFSALEWANCAWRISQQDLVVEHRGGHSLNDPAGLVSAWLQHITRHGAKAAAGTIVTTGAWLGMQRLSGASLAGAAIEVGFEGLRPVAFSVAR